MKISNLMDINTHKKINIGLILHFPVMAKKFDNFIHYFSNSVSNN